uniref:Neur_chan_LBD domain-containing protein n=1 Tax=Steinernema glaseri TaxID=37863 RepID=A0A1I8A9L2_9BILA
MVIRNYMKSVSVVFFVVLFFFVVVSLSSGYVLKRNYEYPRSVRTIYGMVPDFSAMMRVYGKRSDTDLLSA